MSDAAAIILEMEERAKSDHKAMWWPEKSDLLRWADGKLERVEPMLEATAALIARGYARGELTFEFCDSVVNGLYAAFIELPLKKMPPVFYDVFLAFDAGEYPHAGDDAIVNPVREYTDQQIHAIVEALKT